MSLKQRLFRAPWESKDAAQRLASVRSDNDPRLLQALPEIASGDDDANVRIAALKRLNQEHNWLAARNADPDDTVREAADQALLRWVCESASDASLDARAEWLSQLQDPELIRKLAVQASHPRLRELALDRIQSQGFLGDRVIEEADDALALKLINRIDQPSTLKRIAEALRKRNRGRHRAVADRMLALEHDGDTHHAADKRAAQLLKQLEALVRGNFQGDDRSAEIQRIESAWQRLGALDDTLQKRFDGALAIARRALAPKTRPADEPASDQSKPARPPDATLRQLTQKAQQMVASPLGEEASAQVHGLMSEFDRRFNTLTKPSDAERALAAEFRALSAELQSRLETHAKPAPTPARQAPQPDTERTQQLEALQHALDEADKALDGGDVRHASEAVNAARSAFDRIPVHKRPRQAGGRLTRMAGRLKEMRDWQHWSNNELRERLIERVGQIDVEQLHPDAVTARLKELRQRWQELDRQELLPGDKRKFAAPRGQWRRFQKACNEVFEAAKPYLEQRTEVRRQSLQDLNEFLTQANQVLDDARTSGDKLLRFQRAAREAIRNLEALPPKSRGESAGKLRKLMDRISNRLEDHFEQIEAEKRRLVAEARKLAHERDRETAIERAKTLQAEWKRAGRGRRKIEDKLWKEFREPIDPLFETLDAERKARQDEQQAHLDSLKALCAEAEQLANAANPNRVSGQLAGLEDQFNQAGSAPPALRKRFTKALEQHQAALARQREQEKRAELEHLRTLAALLQQTVEQPDRARQAVPPEVAEDDRLGQRLRARLEQFRAAESIDALGEELHQFSAEARQVAVEMECIAGLETPARDKQLRMDYQIRRLSERLGEHAPKPDLNAERAALERRWLGSFPHLPEQHAELRERVEKAEKILDKMILY